MTAVKKVLLIGGSLNQSMMMHAVGRELAYVAECFYSPLYADGVLSWPRRLGWLDRSAAGFGNFYRDTMAYFKEHRLPLDPEGRAGDYDLVVISTDLLVPRNIRAKKIVLVQEGMTDPENWIYRLVRILRLPAWLAVNTCATGLSNLYADFCVASEGYREHFRARGVPVAKMTVTGIPNYDNAAAYLENDFPHHGHVLVATSDTREAMKFEDRPGLIERCRELAGDRPLIFKLHPNENRERAKAEIARYAPRALVYDEGNVHHMIANCEELVTRFSTVVYTGLALGKRVHSDFDVDNLRRLLPWQNGGTSGRRIAEVCRKHL